MTKSIHPLKLDNWPIRRKWMLSVLLWAVGNAQYIIVWGDDTVLNQSALYALLALIAGIIGSYVFGAVWDDNDKRRLFSRYIDRRGSEPGSEESGE